MQIDIKELFKIQDVNKQAKEKTFSLSRAVKLTLDKKKGNNNNNMILNNLGLQNFNSNNNFNLLCVRI